MVLTFVWLSVYSLVRVGCPGAFYSRCMLVMLSATRCVFNWDHVMRYSGAVCRGRAHACDNLVGKIYFPCVIQCTALLLSFSTVYLGHCLQLLTVHYSVSETRLSGVLCISKVTACGNPQAICSVVFISLFTNYIPALCN